MSFILEQKLLSSPFHKIKSERTFKSIDFASKGITHYNIMSNLTGNEPYNVIPNQHEGRILTTPTQMFYNTIYFDPNFFNLGNIASSYSLELFVWNAYLKPVKLNELIYDDTQGVIIETPNLEFRQLQLSKYKIKVEKNGTPIVDILAQFKFSNGFNFVLPITGSRTVIVSYIPDQKFTEILRYKTEISQSRRKELRAKLSSKPTREFHYTYTLNEPLLAHFLDSFNSAQTKQYLVPTWQEMMYLSNITAGTKTIELQDELRGFDVNSYIIFWDSEWNNFLTKITAINGKVATLKDEVPRDFNKCYVIPCVSSIVPQAISVKREYTNNVFKADVKYLQSNVNLQAKKLDLPMLDNEPILDIRQTKGDITSSQKVKIIDDNLSQPFIHSLQNQGLFKLSYDTAISSIEQYHKWYDIISYCSGRFKAFWLPTWFSEFAIIEEIKPQQSLLLLEYNNNFSNKNAVRIEVGENVHYSKIIKNDIVDGKTQISIADPLPFAVKLNSNYRISLMFRVRLDKDDVKISHKSYYHKNITFGTSEVL